MKLTALTFLVLSIAFPVGNLATKLQHPRKKLPNSRVPWNEGVAPLTASSPMKKGRRRGFGTHHRGSVSSDARNLESTAATAFQTWPWHERGLRALSKSSSSGWERPACCSGGLSAIKMQYTGPNGTTLSLPGADLQEDGASSHVIGPCGETMKDFKDGYESVRFVNCTSCFPSGTASSGCETASDSWGTILVNNQDFVCLISVHDDATVALEEKLPTDVQVLYQPSGNSNLNTVAIHTSCSKPVYPPYAIQFDKCEDPYIDLSVGNVDSTNLLSLVFLDGVAAKTEVLLSSPMCQSDDEPPREDHCCKGGISFLKLQFGGLLSGVLTLNSTIAELYKDCDDEDGKHAKKKSKGSTKKDEDAEVWFVPCSDSCILAPLENEPCTHHLDVLSVTPETHVCLAVLTTTSGRVAFDKKMPTNIELFLVTDHDEVFSTSIHTSCSTPVWSPYAVPMTDACLSQDTPLLSLDPYEVVEEPHLAFIDGISPKYYELAQEHSSTVSEVFKWSLRDCKCPTACASGEPTVSATGPPSRSLSTEPSFSPSLLPSMIVPSPLSIESSTQPSISSQLDESMRPSIEQSFTPSMSQNVKVSKLPTFAPTEETIDILPGPPGPHPTSTDLPTPPSLSPTIKATLAPSVQVSSPPTWDLSAQPTEDLQPSCPPTEHPSAASIPTVWPSISPTEPPSAFPTLRSPTFIPSGPAVTHRPTESYSSEPTMPPSLSGTPDWETSFPSTAHPIVMPTPFPTSASTETTTPHPTSSFQLSQYPTHKPNCQNLCKVWALENCVPVDDVGELVVGEQCDVDLIVMDEQIDDSGESDESDRRQLLELRIKSLGVGPLSEGSDDDKKGHHIAMLSLYWKLLSLSATMEKYQ